MLPVARLSDFHICPMVNGLVPHVGGPILPICAIRVLSGGLPTARIGDLALCVGPPDSIVTGVPKVLVMGKPVARITDKTMHGGMIMVGLPNVLIGGGTTAQVQAPTVGNALFKGLKEWAIGKLKKEFDPPKKTKSEQKVLQAERKGLRGFIAKTKELIAQGRANAKAEDAKPDKEKMWKVGGEAGVAYDGRKYDWKRGDDKDFLKNKPFETSVSVGAEKTWLRGEKRGLYYGDDGANLTVGKVSGSFSSGVDYDLKNGVGSVSVIRLEGSAALLQAQAEKEVAGGLLKGTVKGEVLSVGAKANLLAFSRDKKGKIEATLADVGVEANLVKGEIGGEIAITPRTIYDNFIGPVVGLFGGAKKLAKDSTWVDHGLVLGGKAEAGIGAAAKASAKFADGKFQFGAKAGAGPMAGLAFSIGLK